MNDTVSKDEWIAARKKLLIKEKEFTQLRDQLSQARRELPWTRVDADYRFQGDAGACSLRDLFAGSSQLVIYHFMFGPDWQVGCKSCSFWADSFNGVTAHLKQRDVAFAAVSRAPLEKLRGFAERLGWSFRWVSSQDTSFNFDFGVSFTQQALADGSGVYNYEKLRGNTEGNTELPGISVFAKDASGAVFHTYSCFARGLDLLNTTYNFLDLVPKGRDEAGLPATMSWVRYRDEYAWG